MNSSPKLSTLSTTSSPSSSTPSIQSSISTTPEDPGNDLPVAKATPLTELDRSSFVSAQSPPLSPRLGEEDCIGLQDPVPEIQDGVPVVVIAADATAALSIVSTPDLGSAQFGTAANCEEAAAGTLSLPVPAVVEQLGNGQHKGPAISSVGLPSASPGESSRAPSPTDRQRKQRSRIGTFLLSILGGGSKKTTTTTTTTSTNTTTKPRRNKLIKHASVNNSTFTLAALHQKPTLGAGAGIGAGATVPRDNNYSTSAANNYFDHHYSTDQACSRAPTTATLENVVLHAPTPSGHTLTATAAPSRLHHHHHHHNHNQYSNYHSGSSPSRSPSLSSFNTTRSYNPRSIRRLRSRRSSNASNLSIASSASQQLAATPVIFRSTAACRLSVPVEALRDLQTIKEHDISRKMHQTSSRLLRMTEDERPYTRDFKDLFSTLMVSLPLTPHRVRFQRIDHTFTSEEAITNLGSLKFSQSNRMPDPKDPSRIVTTTTTTTFSMAREMAKSVCQKFLEARFVESVDSKNDFSSKSAVWQLTPKGMHILQRFCSRNGINQRHVQMVLESPRNTMHLVLLEREADGDRIYRDQATIEVVFRRFVGQDGPNLKWSTANSDSDSVTDYQTGLIGVKMARERKVGDKTYWNTFTGKAAVDWLMDCCTMVDKRETIELAGLFVDCGLIHPVEGTVPPGKFSPQKNSIYFVTDKGQKVAGWIPSTTKNGTAHNDANAAMRKPEGSSRDSNANRMTIIIKDPALRLLFREFLRDTHCEENLAFYLDVKEFLANYQQAKQSTTSTLRLDTIRETLAAAYSLYNAFLAPGSPCELNIDHSLRTALAARMTRAVGDDEATIASLDEVAGLFDQAQTSVFKLMASDSVPKFMREPKYVPVIRERNLDVIIGGLNAAAPRA